MPALMSAIGTPTRVGPPSCSPDRNWTPPMPCRIASYAGWRARGPVWPKPDTEQKTSDGFSSLRLLVAQAQALHGAGPKVLDQDVG